MVEIQNLKFKIQNYRNILIVRLDRIGDVVLSTPAIRAVREACPASRISVMVSPYARGVVEGNPCLDEVIAYDKSGPEKGFLGNLRFIREIRKRKFDLALVLHPTGRSHIIAALSGIPLRVGYGRKLAFLVNRRIPHTKQFGLKHEIDYTLDILKYAGIKSSGRSLYVPVTPESELKIGKIFREGGIGGGDTVVVLNPGASCPSKRWAPENFASVAAKLAAERGAKIVVISGVPDKGCGDAVASILGGGCLNLSGKTDVSDLASVMKRAALFISNDSGPVHIACAVGTPVIVIFGRADRGLSPLRWGPSGARDIVFHRDVGCGTCLAHGCVKGFKCLDAVKAGEVAEAALRLTKGQKT
jgi:lipopolysaccharide heptosyltransferase II